MLFVYEKKRKKKNETINGKESISRHCCRCARSHNDYWSIPRITSFSLAVRVQCECTHWLSLLNALWNAQNMKRVEKKTPIYVSYIDHIHTWNADAFWEKGQDFSIFKGFKVTAAVQQCQKQQQQRHQQLLKLIKRYFFCHCLLVALSFDRPSKRRDTRTRARAEQWLHKMSIISHKFINI